MSNKIITRKRCTNCNEGELKSTGEVVDSKQQHVCNKCGHKETLQDAYPKIEQALYTEERWEEDN